MKATKFQSYIIIVRSLIATLDTSLRVIICNWFGRLTRTYVDQLSRRWGKKCLEIINLSYKIFDPYRVKFEPSRSYVIMSNHCSHYDIPLILAVFPKGSIRMITKKELFKVPVWGKAMFESEFLSIDRDNPRQSVKDLKFIRQKMADGIIPWIAPEGTRSRTGKMQKIKKGGFALAYDAKAIIIPVGIRGTCDVLPAKSIDFNINEEVEVHIGKPINVADYIKGTKNEIIQALMKDVEASLKIAAGQ